MEATLKARLLRVSIRNPMSILELFNHIESDEEAWTKMRECNISEKLQVTEEGDKA